jgi:hypothetical protein
VILYMCVFMYVRGKDTLRGGTHELRGHVYVCVYANVCICNTSTSSVSISI